MLHGRLITILAFFATFAVVPLVEADGLVITHTPMPPTGKTAICVYSGSSFSATFTAVIQNEPVPDEECSLTDPYWNWSGDVSPSTGSSATLSVTVPSDGSWKTKTYSANATCSVGEEPYGPVEPANCDRTWNFSGNDSVTIIYGNPNPGVNQPPNISYAWRAIAGPIVTTQNESGTDDLGGGLHIDWSTAETITKHLDEQRALVTSGVGGCEQGVATNYNITAGFQIDWSVTIHKDLDAGPISIDPAVEITYAETGPSGMQPVDGLGGLTAQPYTRYYYNIYLYSQRLSSVNTTGTFSWTEYQDPPPSGGFPQTVGQGTEAFNDTETPGDTAIMGVTSNSLAVFCCP